MCEDEAWLVEERGLIGLVRYLKGLSVILNFVGIP